MFIQLTEFRSGPVLVNTQHIESVCTLVPEAGHEADFQQEYGSKGAKTLVITSKGQILVKETYEQVVGMINPTKH